MSEIAKICVVVLAVVSLLGGIMGFVKAKSKASIIAGTISAALLAACYFVSMTQVNYGLIGAAVVAMLLQVHFGRSFKKTKKPMPAIPMLVLSSITEIMAVVAVALDYKANGHL